LIKHQVQVMREGTRLSASPSLEEIRERARPQVGALHPTIRRLLNPHEYPVGLDSRLQERRLRMVEEARKRSKG
jgi:nicotinate phosphoribosyltransferase